MVKFGDFMSNPDTKHYLWVESANMILYCVQDRRQHKSVYSAVIITKVTSLMQVSIHTWLLFTFYHIVQKCCHLLYHISVSHCVPKCVLKPPDLSSWNQFCQFEGMFKLVTFRYNFMEWNYDYILGYAAIQWSFRKKSLQCFIQKLPQIKWFFSILFWLLLYMHF